VHEAAWNVISKCDADLHKEMCANIVLAGGSSMLPGFSARLDKELSALVLSSLFI
jgi:actin-related protein